MANNLETRTSDYSPESYNNQDYSNGLEYAVMPKGGRIRIDPMLRDFVEGIKDKNKRRDIEIQINYLHAKYIEDLKRNVPVITRAELLEQAWNIAGQEPPEGKEPIHVLNQKLYSNPGRQYQYINGVVGNEKNSKGIRYKLGNAAKYAIKEGWPVLGAGAGWVLANRWYNKGNKGKGRFAGMTKSQVKKQINQEYKPLYKPWEYAFPGIGPAKFAGDIGMKIAKGKAKKEAGVGALGRLGQAYDNPFWEYLGPKGVLRFGTDTAKFIGGEALRGAWKLIRTPALYAIGAYATYKVIKYLIKRRKEKKLEHEEVEKLENMRNEMLAQKHMFYIHQPAVAGAA